MKLKSKFQYRYISFLDISEFNSLIILELKRELKISPFEQFNSKRPSLKLKEIIQNTSNCRYLIQTFFDSEDSLRQSQKKNIDIWKLNYSLSPIKSEVKFISEECVQTNFGKESKPDSLSQNCTQSSLKHIQKFSKKKFITAPSPNLIETQKETKPSLMDGFLREFSL